MGGWYANAGAASQWSQIPLPPPSLLFWLTLVLPLSIFCLLFQSEKLFACLYAYSIFYHILVCFLANQQELWSGLLPPSPPPPTQPLSLGRFFIWMVQSTEEVQHYILLTRYKSLWHFQKFALLKVSVNIHKQNRYIFHSTRHWFNQCSWTVFEVVIAFHWY